MLSPDNDSMMDVGIFIAENPMAGSYDGLIVKPIFSRIPFTNFKDFNAFLTYIIDINSINVSNKKNWYTIS